MKRLNEAQKRAVEHTEGPCLVLAGPGSGKTLTVVNRIRYLMEEKNVRPEEILVITFTKFAAQEMKQRLKAQMEGRNLPVTMGTFHGIYYGILKWACHLGPQNLLSEEEKYQIIRRVLQQKESEILNEEDLLPSLVTEIGIVKNNRLDIESYTARQCPAELFRAIYREYESQRKSEKKIDFDDMLVLCYDLFRKRPDVLKLWQSRFRFILVDEFQDINQVQYEVLRMLAAPEENLFVVGDDDQSIYGFRGADVRLMFQFQKDYPKAEKVLLNVNYRCTGSILCHALRLIGHNTVRFDKDIRAEKYKGAAVHIQETLDAQQEGEYVCAEIQKRRKAKVAPEQIAVLYRVHTDVRALTEQLVKQNIPFFMQETMPNLYQHFIARDLGAYFRLAKGGRDRADFLQVMNRPKRYLGRDSLAGGGEDPLEEMRKYYEDKEWMQDRLARWEQDLRMVGEMAPYAAIQYIRKKIGYDDFLKEYAQKRGQQASVFFEVLAELEEAARPFAELEEWAEHVREYTEVLRQQKRQEKTTPAGVRLLTMHASKGLEFDSVFLIQANEGRIPDPRAVKEQGTEEERRLFYVAMTRAKEILKISYVKMKNGKEAAPSRFLGELSGSGSMVR